MTKRKDFTQIAKLVIDRVTGNLPPEKPDTRNPHALALSRLGAAKGGRVRAANLSAKKRKEIATKAARTHWKRK